MNKLALTFTLIMASLTLSAREVPPLFDSYEWDFGKIMEEDGSVSHAFVITNTTKKNLQITKVVPSCSCTTVDYPRNPLKPNEKAEITVTFSPSGAVGPVFRSVEVYDYDNQCIGVLEIKADVTPLDRSIQERYHYTLNDFLYTNLNKVPFGYVYHGTQKTKIIYLANTSDHPMNISIENTDEKLTLDYPKTLQPNEEAELSMTFSSPADKELYATVSDTLYIYNEGKRSLIPITVSMIMLSEPEQTQDAAVLRTYPSLVRQKKKGKKYLSQIDIFNDGESNLIIRNIELPEYATANIPNGTQISAGTKTTLEIQSTQPDDFTVNIFTNDPKRPVKDITVSGK